MAATHSHIANMDQCVSQLAELYPGLQFHAGDTFYWSPRDSTVHYRASSDAEAIWSLLHETSHGILGHTDFGSDFHLLRLETEAWQRAQLLAHMIQLSPIDANYIEDCLDTYRDWLHRRATCPECKQTSLMTTPGTYQCLNCQATWQVTQSRHCRPYRTRKRVSIDSKAVAS